MVRINSKILCDGITKASRTNKICVVDDFSFRNIKWKNFARDAESEAFLEMVQDHSLYQQALETVRRNNILDLVFSNKENTKK